jgi:hypothetical protein
MMQGSSNPFPIQVVVNYWEKPSSELGPWLDSFLTSGVRRLAALIPWHCFETDLTHSLRRFIQAAAERQIQLLLIPSLEPGVHYPYSGIPKEWVCSWDTLGTHVRGSPIMMIGPPQIFGVPSFFQPEFLQKYYQHLSKIDALLADLGRSDERVVECVSVGLSGSFWKYFRAPEDAVESPFFGRAGDYSQHTAQGYRKHLEHFYSQREIQNTDPTVVERFRSTGYDDVNRRVFYQQSEELFRIKQNQCLSKRSLQRSNVQLEICTPEFDPAYLYSSVFSAITGQGLGFERLDQIIEEASVRRSTFEGMKVQPWVRWTALGGFEKLNDAEKQYLIFKSLILFGGAGGGVFLDELIWRCLKSGFRKKLDSLASDLSSGLVRIPSRALYLTHHLWSDFGSLWTELMRRTYPWSSAVSSVDGVVADREADLVLIDPQVILNRETVARLISLTKTGKIVAFPKARVYTDAARRELDTAFKSSQIIEMDLGVRYQILPLGEGKLILYEIPDVRGEAFGELYASIQTFLGGLTTLAGIRSPCRVVQGGKGLLLLPLRTTEGMGLFVLNSQAETVDVTIEFRSERKVFDYFSKHNRETENEGVNLKQLELQVPSYGILALAVETLDQQKLGASEGDLKKFNPDIEMKRGPY